MINNIQDYPYKKQTKAKKSLTNTIFMVNNETLLLKGQQKAKCFSSSHYFKTVLEALAKEIRKGWEGCFPTFT